MSMSVWFDNIAQLNSSRTALPRRAFSYSPAIQASRLEELREVLEEKFRQTKLPGEFLNDLISQECTQNSNSNRSPMTLPAYSTLLQKIDYLSDQINSACCNFVGDTLLLATHKQLKLQYQKPQQVERSVDLVLKDLQLRRTQVERYNRTFKQEGYYTLNQFVATDEEIDVGGQSDMRLVAVHCWNLNFAKAEAVCNSHFSQQQNKEPVAKQPPSPLKHSQKKPVHPSKADFGLEMAILRPLLHGFANLQTLLRADTEVAPFFIRRQVFDINGPSLGQQVLGLLEQKQLPFNILCTELTESVQSIFLQQSLAKRISIIRHYLNFLAECCRGYQQQQNCNYHVYFRAIVSFLGNNRDRKQQIYSEILDINGVWLVDQFFFAHRFLSDELMSGFMVTFRERITRSRNLVNLALCATIKQKVAILQNYLDYTSELETVAVLAYNEKSLSPVYVGSSEFDKFINAYKQAMVMEGKPHRLEILDIRQRSQSRMRSSPMIDDVIREPLALRTMPVQYPFFFRTIDFKNKSNFGNNKEILETPPPVPLPVICTICTMEVRPVSPSSWPNRRQHSEEMYIGCLKCRHGGHSRHILSWFERNERCPKSDCICLCN